MASGPWAATRFLAKSQEQKRCLVDKAGSRKTAPGWRARCLPGACGWKKSHLQHCANQKGGTWVHTRLAVWEPQGKKLVKTAQRQWNCIKYLHRETQNILTGVRPKPRERPAPLGNEQRSKCHHKQVTDARNRKCMRQKSQKKGQFETNVSIHETQMLI